MPEYLAPGVYVEENSFRARRVEGAPTSIAAILGQAARGPVALRLVRSFAEYDRLFGLTAAGDGHLPHAVRGFFDNGGEQAVIGRIVGAGAQAAQRVTGGLTLRAIGPGAWGNGIRVRIEAGAAGRMRLRVALSAPGADPAADPFDPASGAAMVEDFPALSFVDAAAAASSIAQVAHASALIAPEWDSGGGAPVPAGTCALDGGQDGAAIGAADHDAALTLLEDVAWQDVSLILAPGAESAVVDRLIAHCDAHRDRMAIIDCTQAEASGGAIAVPPPWDSSRAALYLPWLIVGDINSGADRMVPPSGHVAGIYARTDRERGVHKAPANEVVLGIRRFSRTITAGEQERLNPAGINVLRFFAGRGYRVWGARTLSRDPEWKYVNVRRYAQFLERSIERGTRFAVFEPNGPALWAAMRQVTGDFLQQQWQTGALMGVKARDAYFVKCDPTTMTQADRDAGRVIMEIGLAITRPAEFIILRIVQMSAGAG